MNTQQILVDCLMGKRTTSFKLAKMERYLSETFTLTLNSKQIYPNTGRKMQSYVGE